MDIAQKPQDQQILSYLQALLRNPAGQSVVLAVPKTGDMPTRDDKASLQHSFYQELFSNKSSPDGQRNSSPPPKLSEERRAVYLAHFTQYSDFSHLDRIFKAFMDAKPQIVELKDVKMMTEKDGIRKTTVSYEFDRLNYEVDVRWGKWNQWNRPYTLIIHLANDGFIYSGTVVLLIYYFYFFFDQYWRSSVLSLLVYRSCNTRRDQEENTKTTWYRAIPA